MEALNVVYGAEETRPYWKVRVIATLLTIGLAGFIIISMTLILYGARSGMDFRPSSGWAGCSSSPGIIAMACGCAAHVVGLAIIYYICPMSSMTGGGSRRVLSAPSRYGSVSRLGFKTYVDHFGNYNAAYGPLQE